MRIQTEDKNLVIFESALCQATSTLIKAEDYLLLIDPNWLPDEISFINEYISEIDHGQKKYLLFTHSDRDHIIGYGKFKDYVTIASLNFAGNAEKKDAVRQIIEFDDQYYIHRDYPIDYPDIQIVIGEDYQQMQLGSDEYSFFLAPGHTNDGLIVWNKSAGILVAGDYLSNIELPLVDDSFRQYKKTLDKFAWLITETDVKILVTGHGDCTASKVEMIYRLNDSKSYLKELEHAIGNFKSFDIDEWSKRYEFPRTVMKYHRKNINTFRKEFDIDTDHVVGFSH